jgi:hypothetical protein
MAYRRSAPLAPLAVTSPNDMICAVSQLFGFTPADSVVVMCLHGSKNRLGLVLRFDLDDAREIDPFVRIVHARVDHEGADRILVVIFTDRPATGVPGVALAEGFDDVMGARMLDVVATDGTRWWSPLCDGSCCGGSDGLLLETNTPSVMALRAAYAMAGQGVLPDRDAVVRSVALVLDARGKRSARDRIRRALRRWAQADVSVRRSAMRVLIRRLAAATADPRATIAAGDLAELAALSQDVVVRDEVLLEAVDPDERDALVTVLKEAARRTPPPFDPPVCSMLAWVAYADGDGVVASIAAERAIASDPAYSLATLIVDALYRQVSPDLLQQVMRDAERDLRAGVREADGEIAGRPP